MSDSAVRFGFRRDGWRDRPLALAGVCGLALLAGCSLLRPTPRLEEKIDLLAVLPLERVEPVGVAPAGEEGPQLAPGAERVVTAQIYSVLSSSPTWRFVPDLTVTQALAQLPGNADLITRAATLGKAVGADGVLFGTVSRYSERVGAEYGAKQPAAVAFTLKLLSVASGKIVWTESFDEHQQALSANLFNWWQFWRGGPRWFTAQEFARLGVERLLEDLSRRLAH